MRDGENPTRRAGARVSGWRRANQTREIAATASMKPKIARQWAIMRMTCPIPGASAGTMMNTAITSDMTRAMARPSYRSRTRATVTLRGPAAPRPWSTRPASMTVKSVARIDIRQPRMNSSSPAWIAGLRP